MPKIVYDCLTTIISRVDIHVGSTGKFKKDMMREIKNLSDQIEETGLSIQHTADKMKLTLDEDRKLTQEMIDKEAAKTKKQLGSFDGRVNNLRTRVDKDADQMLRQDNQMTDMSVLIRGNHQ